MTHQRYTLEQTSVIRPFLTTYLPEQGREYSATFRPPVEMNLTYEKITGILLEYPDHNLLVSVTIHHNETACESLTIRVTNTKKRLAQSFYDKVKQHLFTRLCEPLAKHPEYAEEIVLGLLR